MEQVPGRSEWFGHLGSDLTSIK